MVEMLGMEVDMRVGITRVTKGRVEKLKSFVESCHSLNIQQAYGVFAVYVSGTRSRLQVEDEDILCNDHQL